MDPNSVDRRKLPYVLAEIADAAGVEAMLAIVAAYGGRTAAIPGRSDRNNWLTRLVGAEKCAAIIKAIGFGNISIPIAHALRVEERRRLAAQMRQAGRSVSNIAVTLGITSRTVQRYRQLDRRKPPTPPKKDAK